MSERAEERLAGRRRLIKFAGASLFLTVSPIAKASANRTPRVLAVRIWPAPEYTRVTIEHSAPLKYTHFTVKNPERLVVDLERQEVREPIGTVHRFEIDAFRRESLLQGLDEIGVTLRDADDIRAYEQQRAASAPWLFSND